MGGWRRTVFKFLNTEREKILMDQEMRLFGSY